VSSTNGGRKNFDQVHPEYEDRAFTIGGQDFHWMPMWWREFGQMIEDETDKVIARQREREEYEKEAERLRAAGQTVPDPPDEETLVDSYEELIDAISKYLDPSEVDRFKEVMNDPSKRISAVQLAELRDWIRDVANNRPTEQSSPSEPGPGLIEATSLGA
jgi:hypothetical protein